MTMEKIYSKVYKFLLLFLFIIFIILTCNSIFIEKLGNGQQIKPLFVLLLSITYLVFLFKLNKFILSKQKNEGNLIAVFLSIIGFCLLFLFSYYFCVLPNRDLNTIIIDAKSLVDTNSVVNTDYYSIYSNQVGILFTLKYVFKLADLLHIDRNIFTCLISSLSISISIFFTYLCIKKVSNKSLALTLLIYLIFNPLFYLLVSFYYSDIFIMPIMSIVVYILLCIKDSKLNLKNIILLILVGLLCYIGYKIRAVIIFILLAFIIIMIFKWKIKDLLKYSIFIFLGIVIGYGIFGLLEKDNNIKYDNNIKFPATHWIMMGLNYEHHGRYNSKDYEATNLKYGYNNKKEYNKKEILHRLKDNGVLGNLSLQSEKLKINWAYGDGAYSSYYYSTTKYISLYDYINGNSKIYLGYLLQLNRVVLFIMISISLIIEINKKKKEYNFIILFIFISLLFYSLWEVYLRYSFCFLPLLTLLGSLNLNKLSNINLKIDNKDIFKVKKYLYIFIVLLTMYSFIESYNNYCRVEKNYFTTAANSDMVVFEGTSVGDLMYDLNKDTEYKQTFKTNRSFNYIKIKYNSNESLNGKIYLSLYDENNKIVKKFAKNMNNIKNKEYLVYTFDKPINTHNKTYTFVITTDIEDSNVKLMGLKSLYYDYFPMGELYLNNKKLNSDLQVNIGREVNAPLLNKKVYLLCAFFIMCIQLIVFDLIRIKKRTN